MTDKGLKLIAKSIAGAGLAAVGAFLLTHDHQTAGVWTLVVGIMCVIG